MPYLDVSSGGLGNIPEAAWASVGRGLGTGARAWGWRWDTCRAPLTPLLCVLLPQFDPGNTGYISTGKFRSLLESHSSKLDPHKREVLLALADSQADGQIGYQDFVNLVSTLGRSLLGGTCLGCMA